MSHLKLVDIAPRDPITANTFSNFAKTLRKSDGGGDNGGMENRVKVLETGMIDVRERLVRIETRLDNMPTKADLSDSVHGQTKWIFGLAISLFGIGLAAAKWLI